MIKALQDLADKAYEAVASACHWGDGWQAAGLTVEKQIQAAYDLDRKVPSIIVHTLDSDIFVVRLESGVQSFDVGPEWPTTEEAEHHASMLRKALGIS